MRLQKISAFFTLLIVITFSSFSEAEPKIRVAVLNASDVKDNAGQSEIVANNFTGVLTRSGAVTVVEREKLELLMREQKINFQNLTPDTAAKIGKVTGAQYTLLSTLVYDASPVISVRIIDNQTSEIIFSDTEIPDTLDESAIIASSSRLADRVLEVLAGEQAIITDIRGKEIVINRGSSAGVRNGNLYRVYTGTKRNPVNLAIIRVKDVRANFSHAEIIKNGGKIEILRRVDKVEAISKEEANSIITRKKFAKKRPNEKIISESTDDTKKNKNNLQGEVIDFEKIIGEALDKLEKQSDIAIKKEDYKLRNDVGKDFVELGYTCFKYSTLNEFGIQLTTTGEMLKSTKTQEELQENVQQFDKNAQMCFLIAKKLFEMSLSAKKDNPEALNNLGLLYGDGLGVEEDDKKAVEFFTKAAAQGHANAYNNLGYMYMEGLGGLKKNIKKAVELYRKAAEKEDPEGLCSLGYVYMEGLGVKRDDRMALKLLNQSVAKGNAGAYINLGSMYVVSQDANKALECFKKAALLGDNLCLEMAIEYLHTFFQ